MNVEIDNIVKIDYNRVISNKSFSVNAVGSDSGEILLQADYTYTNINSIFISKSGNDTTGDGTQSLPYLTVYKGIQSCTALKTKVIILDSEMYAESFQSITNTFFAGLYAASGQTSKLVKYTYDNNYIPSDSNTIFVSPSGSDATGIGTESNPIKTILKASTLCDTDKQNILLEDGTYEEGGIKFTNNVKNIRGRLGKSPAWNIKDNGLWNETGLLKTLRADTNLPSQYDIFRYDSSYYKILILPADAGYIYIANDYTLTSPRTYRLRVTKYDINFTELLTGTIEVWNDLFNSIKNIDAFIQDDGNIFIAWIQEEYNSSQGYKNYVKCCTLDTNFNYVKNTTILQSYPNYQIYIMGYLGITPYEEDGIKKVFITYTHTRDSTVTTYFMSINQNTYVVTKSPVNIINSTVFFDVKFINDKIYFFYQQDVLHALFYKTFNKSTFALIDNETQIIDFGMIEGQYCYSNYFEITKRNDNGYALMTAVMQTSPYRMQIRLYFLDSIFNILRYDILYSFDWSVSSHRYLCFEILKNKIVYIFCKSNSPDIKASQIYYLDKPLLYFNTDANICNLKIKSFEEELIYTENIINTTSKINIYNINFEDFINSSYGLSKRFINSNTELNIYNSIFKNISDTIYTVSNKSKIKNCILTSFKNNYTLWIKGAAAASGDIEITHNTIFDNYSGIKLENNNGANEIVKNNIIHDNSNFGLWATTQVSESNSINTCSNYNVLNVSKILNQNPLFINEGYYNPDQLNLNLKLKVLGFKTDSPAYKLADDSKDAGAYDIIYVGYGDSWNNITIKKPIKGIAVKRNPVGENVIIKKDGSIETSVSGWTEYIEFSYDGIDNDDYAHILTMMTCGVNLVRLYMSPTTYPNEYIIYKIVYDSISGSAKDHYKLNRTGKNDVKFTLARGYANA